MSSSARAPIVLAIVIATGFATRYLREAKASGPDTAVSVAALDSQLVRVQAAASGARPGANRRSGGSRAASAGRARSAPAGSVRSGRSRAKPQARTAAPDSAGAPDGLRIERTPYGALPLPDVARRARDSLRHAAAAAERARATPTPRRPPPVPTRPRGTAGTAGTATSAPGATARAPRPLVDLDAAPASEIDRLPGIGPALARRIVEDREANGPFGSLAELQRVRGIGPALAARLRGRVTFTGPGRP